MTFGDDRVCFAYGVVAKCLSLGDVRCGHPSQSVNLGPTALSGSSGWFVMLKRGGQDRLRRPVCGTRRRLAAVAVAEGRWLTPAITSKTTRHAALQVPWL